MAQPPPDYNEKDMNPVYPSASGEPGQAPYPQPGQAPYPQPGQAPYPQPGQAPYTQPGFAPASVQQYNTPGQYGMQPAQQSLPIFTQPGGPVVAYQGTGLEYMSGLQSINIFQVMHMEEVVIGWERNNEYKICDSANQQFMTAKEETDCCNRQCWGTARPFTINLTTLQGQIPIQLNRELRGQGCCCPCWMQEMEICSPPGNKVATIRERWTCVTPKLEVFDASENLIFRIDGECCYIKCCTDVPFKISHPDGSAAGDIIKHWGGCREMCGQVNDFTVNYGTNETSANKVILLGCAFLIDFMFFEVNKN